MSPGTLPGGAMPTQRRQLPQLTREQQAADRRAALRRYHAARRVLDPETGRMINPDLHPEDSQLTPRHGTSNGRTNYSCECWPCTWYPRGTHAAPVIPTQRQA
ncbi:MAG: hypothetical protein JWO67_6239 [Streptosporangiaceae bacterium]|nr:hypothetical protein [Streptosporangiaceae bacterium]